MAKGEFMSMDKYIPPKWEYKVIHLRSQTLSEFESMLNEYGIEGWELCHMQEKYMILKREK